jgi:hypothetical protein
VFKHEEPVEVLPYPKIANHQNVSELLVTDIITSFETAGNINVINLGPYDESLFEEEGDPIIHIDIPHACSTYPPIITL